MLIVEAQTLDVYRNLALEAYLMEQMADAGPLLFLWRSDCAVVMGKNQNPWRECRLDWMTAEGVPLARRISGGGTVYHDAGNLNYCVIVDRAAYREEQAYEMVFSALATLGVQAERTGKSNLSVNGYKFSGNAFCFRKGRAMHHGTLLLDTDLDRLNRYLGSMIDGIETHAIASVPADVANLGLERDAVISALKAAFYESYGPAGSGLNHERHEEHETDSGLGDLASLRSKPHLNRWDESEADAAILEPLMAQQRTAQWQLDATPRFTVERDGLQLEIVKGIVEQAAGPRSETFCGHRFADVVQFL